MTSIEIFLGKIFAEKMARHICFCLIFIIVFTMPAILSRRAFNFDTNGIYLCFFLLTSVYAGRWCCKKWIANRKMIPFLRHLSVVIIILASIGAKGASIVFSDNKIPFWEFFSTSVPLVILFSLLGVFLALTRSSLLQQMNEARIARQQKQSELDLLLSQLSPHFLFNTLNNLYGLSLAEHEKIPNLLLKLSDLLRYSVYETKRTFVPLSDELAYIVNYVEFEKIHLGNRLVLSIDFSGENVQFFKVAPMILIVFVENAFKHSKNTLNDKIKIEMNLRVTGDDLFFTIYNTCDDSDYNGDNSIQPSNLKEHSGVGLKNTIKRLDLLYADRYLLNRRSEKGSYFVTLQLPAK